MEYVSGNIYIRPNFLDKKGDFVEGHTHNFDHTTFCRRGAIYVEALKASGQVVRRVFKSPDFMGEIDDEYSGVVEGGYHCLIKAEDEHKIVALVDNTIFDCVYAHRTPQGDVVQVYDGWGPSYV